MTTLTKLDISDYLDTEEDIQVFPEESENLCNSEEHQHTIEIAEKAGKTRQLNTAAS